jgi:hypothetical protein
MIFLKNGKKNKMGEIADYYMDIAFEQEAMWEETKEALKDKARALKKNYKLGKAEWHTQAGDALKVDNMTDTHIKNCLAFLERKTELEKTPMTKTWIKIFKLEINKRNKQ